MLGATDIMAPMSKSHVLAVFLATTAAAYAQQPDLSFEVASIHLRTDDVSSYQMKHDPAQITWTGASLRMLFSCAFRDAWDVDGPSWMDAQFTTSWPKSLRAVRSIKWTEWCAISS